MELHRLIEGKLTQWKSRRDHRPLILEGARQVGKTWIMKTFGSRYYEKVAYFNFEESKELRNEFSTTISPSRLIPILSLYCGFEIDSHNTLIIFDEIQECNEALNSLKYFSEDAPQYDILAAGSLLGVAMARGMSFPVGKVEFLRVYPLSFREFLYNTDRRIYDYIDSLPKITTLPEIVYNRLREEYRRYLICGGMPKAVLAMLEGEGVEEVDRVIKDILRSYILDFSKHAPNSDIPRINEIWNSLPSQLAKENRKFLYKLVRPGARAREYENALLWLQQAGLIYKVNCCSVPSIPLAAYQDVSAFKIYVFDIGILRVLSNVPAEVIIDSNPLFKEFKGAYIENAILEALVCEEADIPVYWVSSGRAEVDFLLQGANSIIPMEVKSDMSTSGRSLNVYINKYSPTFALVVSGKNVVVNENVVHIPHGMVGWIKEKLTF